MILNEDFFDDEEYSPTDDITFGKYGSGINDYRYKLVITYVGKHDPELYKDYWSGIIESSYDIFDNTEFDSEFDHSEIIYFGEKNEFVMGFEHKKGVSYNWNVGYNFFNCLLDMYERKFGKIVELSSIKIFDNSYGEKLSRYPIYTCSITTNYPDMIARQIMGKI